MRMRRKARHNGLARIGQILRQAGHFVTAHPGVDEQNASGTLQDNGVGLHELALVDQHTLRDLPQHGCTCCWSANRISRRAISPLTAPRSWP
jgi:hypothetical protein